MSSYFRYTAGPTPRLSQMRHSLHSCTCLVFVTALLVLFAHPVYSQHHGGHSSAEDVKETYVVDGLRVGEKPPPGSAVGRAGLRYTDGGYVHIVFGKPYQRGRTIFGGLVGYDQVWAAGAHRATELFTTVPLMFGEHVVPAGGYSLFLTPSEGHWTFHVNSALGMHLADEYDAAQDLLTLQVKATTVDEPKDGLTWGFDDSGKAILFSWGNTQVTIPFTRVME